MRASLPIALAALAAQAGCVQLVAFDQVLVGQRDLPPSRDTPDRQRGMRCGDEHEPATGSAACAVSCELAVEGMTTDGCGGRLRRLDGRRAQLRPRGMREVELTFTLCGEQEEAFSLTTPRSRIRLRRGALTVEGQRSGDGHRAPSYVDGEGCVERTLVFREGALELAERGRRLCSADGLPSLSRPWTITFPEARGEAAVRTLEVCFRGRGRSGPSSHPPP